MIYQRPENEKEVHTSENQQPEGQSTSRHDFHQIGNFQLLFYLITKHDAQKYTQCY